MNHQISKLFKTDPPGSKLLGGLLKLVRINHRNIQQKNENLREGNLNK